MPGQGAKHSLLETEWAVNNIRLVRWRDSADIFSSQQLTSYLAKIKGTKQGGRGFDHNPWHRDQWWDYERNERPEKWQLEERVESRNRWKKLGRNPLCLRGRCSELNPSFLTQHFSAANQHPQKRFCNARAPPRRWKRKLKHEVNYLSSHLSTSEELKVELFCPFFPLQKNSQLAFCQNIGILNIKILW